MVVRAGVAVFLDANGVPCWFDHLGVARVVDPNGSTPSSDARSNSAWDSIRG
jgi:hypothetical protein